jgi:photosystem II stability/assembly factor-like uncharacterized protein
MQYLPKITFSFTILFITAFFLTSAAQVKPTTAAERMNGLQKRKLLETGSLLKDIPFRNIGPTQMNGRVVDIAVNPADPTEFYVAYASGGLWHTTNNGLSFEPIFEKEEVYSIGDIAVSWLKNRTIWVGTGEANSSRSSYSGNGVYKSADNGKTWQYLGLPESHHIGEIILHPSNPDIAWVAAMGHLYSPNKERGVYKTTDGGKTWKQTLGIDENTGVAEMDINLQNPDELYACAWYRTRRAWDFEPAGATSGIYKSTDGGDTWKLLTAAGSGFPAGATMGRSGVAVYQKNPQIVYAVVDNNATKPDTATKKIDTSKYVVEDLKNISKENFAKLDDKKLDTFLLKNDFPKKYTAAGLKDLIAGDKLKPTDVYDWLIADDGFQNAGIYGCEIYRSDDGGQHWHKTNIKDIRVFSSYGYYFGKIYVSPTDENKVITFGTSIILSTDGGKTFEAVDKNNTHGDWHSCWINPLRDDHWIAGNDGGCNITYDNGKKWFKATSIPVAQFYNITTDNATPYNIYGGLQDNGTWMGASKTPGSGSDFSFAEEKEPEPDEYEWKPIGGGDGMQVQVDTRDNKTAYNGFQFGYYFRVNTDGAKEPLFIHPMHDLGESKLRYNWQTPIWLSRHNQDVFYYGANKFYRSLDKAENMTALSGDLTNGKKPGKVPYGTFTSIHESPLRFGLIYIGTDDGNIQLSKDGGYSWALVNINKSLPKIPAGLWVSRVTASQYKEGRVYAALNGYRYDNFAAYLFVSDDYGTTWKQLGMDLPAEPLNVVKEDPKKENIIYVGSDNGLYASFDMGKTFTTIGNLPRVPVHDIAIQVRDNELVVGTHGRSIYITQLDSVHKVYDKMIKAQQMKAALRIFDPKQMQEGELAVDCPPAKAPKKKKKDGLVVIK